MQLKRRITSVVLSAAMIAGNLMTPVTALAGEALPGTATEMQTDMQAETGASEEAVSQETAPPETSQPETDAPDFTITLPDQEAFGLMYDQTHFLSEDKEKKETVLTYKQGEEVNLDVVVNPEYQLDKLAFQDQNVSIEDYQKKQGKEYPFTWKDEDTLTFTMPDSNLWMVTEWHQLQTEPATAAPEAQAQTDTGTQASVAADGTVNASGEASVSNDTAGETATKEDGTPGAEQNAAPTDQMDGQNQGTASQNQTVTSQSDTASGDQGTASQNQTTPSQSDAELETPDTSISLEADGFPAQGALLMLPEKQVGIDVTEVAEETKFEDVTYPQDTCSSKLVSSDVEAGTPGLYSMVYRIDESTTGRSWYLVRPIRVSDREIQTETEVETGTDAKTETETKSDQKDDSESSESDDVPLETESMTEGQMTAAETETETDIPVRPLFAMPVRRAVVKKDGVTVKSVTFNGDSGSLITVYGTGWENDCSGSWAVSNFSGKIQTSVGTKDCIIYCIEPGVPAVSGGKINVIQADAKIAKGLFYLYGGPAWGMTVRNSAGKSINLKDMMGHYGINTDHEYYAVSHFVLSKIYKPADNRNGWNTNRDGTKLKFNSAGVKAITALYDAVLSLPTAEVSLVGAAPDQVLEAADHSGVLVSPDLTYESTPENKGTIVLPAGDILVTSDGKRRTGTVNIAGGTTFHIERKANGKEQTAKYNLTPKFGTNFIPMEFHKAGKQELGLSYFDGGAYSFKVHYKPDSKVSIKKVAADPAKTVGNPNYSFKNATFTLSGNGLSYTFICDENGNSAEQTVNPGTYTLTETVVPHGFKKAVDQTVTVTSEQHQVFTVADEPITTPVHIQKKSMDEAVTSGNRMYSFENAAFTLTGYGHTYNFTCNAGGTSNTVDVPLGTYTLHETASPAGFKTATDQTVTVNEAQEQAFTVQDEPLVGALNALVSKIPAPGYATTRPTAVAELTVCYYDKAEATGSPKHTWVIRTLKDADGKYRAKLDQAHLGKGSLVYGENRMPLGCITVQETKAPDGYELNSSVWKLQILQSGNSVAYSSTTQPEIQNVPVNAYDLPDIPTFGDLKLGKISAEQGTTTDGDATFAGAEFEVINANDFDVVLNTDRTRAIHPGQVATTIVTGADGTGATSGNLLQTGNYTVREKKAPEGYTLSDKQPPVKIEAKKVTDYSQSSPHKNIPERAGFRMMKKDLELAEKLCTITDKTGAEFRADQTTPNGNVIQGEAKLSGAEFDLINRSRSSVVVDAKVYQPGDTIHTFATDENGEIASPASRDVNGKQLPPEAYLPYGTYELKEVKAPEGFNLRGKNLDVTFTVRREDAGTMKDLNSISAEDDVIRFDIDIHKVQAELNEEDPHDKLEAMEKIQFDIYLDQDMNGDNPKEGAKPYVSIFTNKEGYATTKDEKYPHGRLPYGHYTIIENKASIPEGFGAIRNLHVNGTKDGGVYDGQLIQTGIYQDQHGEWIQLAKIDQDSGKPVLRAGAEIQILKADQKTVVELKDSTNHRKVSTFTTNEEGMAYLPQKLEIGTYYLKEVKAPYGYVLNKNLVEFKVDTANSWDQLITWQMKDKEVKGVLKITKYDAETKKMISGAKFGVYADEKIVSGDGTVQAEKGDLVDTVVIGSDGAGTSRELYLGKYHAAEIAAPEGYVLDKTELPFELTYKDQYTEIVMAEAEASNKPTRLNLLKFEQPVDKDGEWSDAKPEKRLNGITFAITRIGGEEPDRNRAGEVFSGGSLVTDEGGNILLKYIESGIYAVQETATIPGYVLDDRVSYFTVDGDGYIFLSDEKGKILDGQEKSDTAEITRKNQYTRWDFSKVDMNGQELKGAVMQVLDGAGNIASYVDDDGKGAMAAWVSDGRPHRICRLPLGNYILHEQQSIKGYTLATDIPFEVTNTGVLCKVKMTNKKLIVKKLDVLGDGVRKAGLEIYEVHFHEDGTKYLTEEPVEAWKSDGKQYDTSNLQVGHTYRLVETKVPKGYVEAEPIDFTITDDLTDQTVTMMDKKVLVSKVNTKITMIAGAKLEVRDSEGQVVDSWTSDGNAYPVSGLKAGQTYTLVETEAPEGYVLADPIEFKVTKNFFADDSFSLTNTQVFMSKTDVTGENEIPGATMTVADKETGKEVDRWVSGEEPHAISGLHVGGSYILHEEIAAEGYVRASDIDFTVDDGFTVKTVKMVDKQVTMTKTDVTGKKELPGAKLTVTDQETGKDVDSWTSGDKPHAISGLEVGKTYILKEVTAPDGYAVAEEVTFEVPDDGKNQTVSMKDKRVTIDKLDVLGQPVKGAKLAVYELAEDETEKTAEGGAEVNPEEKLQQNAAQTETEEATEAATAPENGAEVAAEEADKTQAAEETEAAAQTGVSGQTSENDQTADSETSGQNSETEGQDAADNSQNAETVTTGTVSAKLGRLVDTWVSDGTPHAVSGLIVGHTYRLVEESAPKGYAVADPRDFTVTKEDADQSIAMVDRQVLISKVDTEITMIAGAHLQVTDADGKVVDNWVSDGTAHAVSGLVVGQTYTLTETEAPAGYVLAAPITFTVSDQADANDQLNLVNKQVRITKTDITGDKEVVGAHLSVVEKETGNTVDNWTSEKEPHPVSGLKVGKTYILTETRPADGYVTVHR